MGVPFSEIGAWRDILEPLVDGGNCLFIPLGQSRSTSIRLPSSGDAILHGRIRLAEDRSTSHAPVRLDLIDEIVRMMKSNPELKLNVEGHTDNVGTAAANKTLSEARAKSVVAALVGQGIAADRLSPVGYGQDKPIADNNTEEGKAKNRRVELVKK
jgi:outer membrane protein OmpA-like peptidoglycan-associated protein